MPQSPPASKTALRPAAAQARTYRRVAQIAGLTAFRVTVKETDLHVQAAGDLSRECREIVLEHRGYLEGYAARYPNFLTTLAPWRLPGPAPDIVDRMAAAARLAGVGPMAAVAGALAECVARGLQARSPEVVVENGGDIFLLRQQPLVVGVFAGRSPLSMKIGLRLDPRGEPLAVCTSSGALGHSLSRGRADAVCIVAREGALADAAATAVANRIAAPADVPAAVAYARQIPGVMGVVAVMDTQLGLWGALEVVPLGKKGLKF
jgi:ApbE superfamily uncharacterized protein (UPF0280 family)